MKLTPFDWQLDRQRKMWRDIAIVTGLFAFMVGMTLGWCLALVVMHP